jgi:hypothetical protein
MLRLFPEEYTGAMPLTWNVILIAVAYIVNLLEQSNQTTATFTAIIKLQVLRCSRFLGYFGFATITGNYIATDSPSYLRGFSFIAALRYLFLLIKDLQPLLIKGGKIKE